MDGATSRMGRNATELPVCKRFDTCVRKMSTCLFLRLSVHAHFSLSGSSHTAAIWAQIAPAVSQRGALRLLVQENT